MTGKEIRSMQMNSKLEEVNEERIIKKESTNVRRSDGLVEESERYRSETKLKDIIKENERQKLELKEKYFECMSQKNILNQKNKNYEK